MILVSHPSLLLPTFLQMDSTTIYTWSVVPNNGYSFINGTSSHSFEPEIQFNNKGSYQVILSVGNQCGSGT
ncbi:MAG: hypothetical protein R2728_09395 [Chitinophagales bacterium]